MLSELELPVVAPPAESLRAECLPLREVVAQSVANVAPTVSPTMNIPLAFASALVGTWFAYLVATVAMVLVGLNINQFARRSASAGSLGTYITIGLGRAAGALAAWAITYAYLMCAIAVTCGFAEYGGIVLHDASLRTHLVLIVICGGAAGFMAFRDVRLSAELMLWLEALSVTLILVLAFIVVHCYGFVDPAQLHPSQWSGRGIGLGLVLCVFSFVGFESATSLGEEARDPLRTIPIAVLSSTIMCGVFFVFMAYVQVLAFHHLDTPLDKATGPLSMMATAAGVPSFGTLISLAAMVSFFACTLASVNAAARVAFSMGRERFLPAAFGRVHPTNGTPFVAAILLSALSIGVCVAARGNGLNLMDIYGYAGTLGTYAFFLVYAAVCVAAVRHLWGEMRPRDVMLAIFTAAFLLVMFYYGISPDATRWIFPVSMAAGFALYVGRRRQMT